MRRFPRPFGLPEQRALRAGGFENAHRLEQRWLLSTVMNSAFASGGQYSDANVAWFTATAAQSDNKVLLAGVPAASASGDDFAVERLTSSGAPDTSFGGNGTVLNGVGGTSAQADAIATQSDGKILVAGTAVVNNGATSQIAMVLVRYNSDGSLDASFGSGGEVLLSAASMRPVDVAVAGNGDIVVGGATSGTNVGTEWEVACFNSDGSINTSFTGGGIDNVSTEAGISPGITLSGLAIDSSNRIVLEGAGSSGGDALIHLCRLLPNGAVDTTFHNTFLASYVATSQSPVSTAGNLLIQPDGKLLTCGWYNGTSQELIMRFNSDGTYDPSFGQSYGIASIPGSNGLAPQIALESSGSIIVSAAQDDAAGLNSNVEFALGELFNNGTLNTHFGSDGIFNAAIAPGNSYPRAVAITPSGMIVQAGSTANSTGVAVEVDPTGSGPAVGSLSGTVYGDDNDSGQVDYGDSGEGGVTVYLDANNNGTLDPGELSAISDQNGNYSFTGLPYGNYQVTAVAPPGEQFLVPQSSYSIILNPTNPFQSGLTFLLSNTDNSIVGTYYNDTNGNGSYQAGESGIPNARIQVALGPYGSPAAIYDITTNAAGQYSLQDIPSEPITLTPLAPGGNILTGATSFSVQESTDFQANSNFFASADALVSGYVFFTSVGHTTYTAANALSGWTVYIDTNNNGILDSGEPSTTTDGFGKYELGVPNSGSYVVREVPQAGYIPDTPPAAMLSVNLSAYNVSYNNNFSNDVDPRTASISGTVFSDNNGNGVQDNNEAGFQGVTVYLDTNHDGLYESGEPVTTTGTNGSYTIGNLLAGTYTVRLVSPSNTYLTLPLANDYVVTVEPGQSATGSNFGQVTYATVSGTAFIDNNGDGVIDSGDQTMAGLQVYIDSNNDGVYDAGEPITSTNSNGSYSFTGLKVGTYVVRQVVISGYQQTLPIGGAGRTVSLTTGQVASGQNFGQIPPDLGTGSISGIEFEDSNGDGVYGPGDYTVAGLQVYIDSNDNGLLDSGEPVATTNLYGDFSFAGLKAGTYVLRPVLISNFHQTLPAGNAPITDTLSRGQAVTGSNFGLALGDPAGTADIVGTVYDDANGNGTQDSQEAGVANVEVYLDANDDGKYEIGEAQHVTDGEGEFSFGGLSAGTYQVRVVPPTGFVQTAPTNSAAMSITLASGQDKVGNFGIAPVQAIGGNISGLISVSGSTMSGITVYLDANNNGVLDTNELYTDTVASGTYAFNNVPAGSYVIRQVVPAGATQTSPVAGGGIAVNVTTGGTLTNENFVDAFNVAAGGNVSGTVTAGGKGVGGITLYLDANNNSKLDSGEVSTTTAANGLYSFSGVAAGAYVVRQVLPAGDTQTSPADGYGLHVTVTNGGNITGQNFVDLVPAPVPAGGSVSGTVTSGGAGIAGVTVFLDANNNSTLDSGEISTITAADGTYSCTNVPAGAYVVRQILPTGDTQTSPANGYGIHVTVTANGSLTGQNFTDTVPSPVPTTGSVSGSVTAGGKGVAGITIYLDANNNSTLDSGELSTVTAAGGTYSFATVPAGAYVVRQVLPPGDTQTSPASGYGIHITVTAGGNLTAQNFVDTVPSTPPAPTGSIAGVVFSDVNSDGKQETGDAGLAGWTVYIDPTNSGSFAAGDLTAVTDSSGDYLFSGLAAGAYIVRVVRPTGYTQTTPVNNYGQHVTLVASQHATAVLFGEHAIG